MITYHKGDIFESGAAALVNPVNCVGTMGAGLAKQFARRCPGILNPYTSACAERKMLPGTMLPVVVRIHQRPTTIINFPTKTHWKQPSSMEFINVGLAALKVFLEEERIESVALPALGCGLGGLKWEDVKPLIEKYLGDLNMDVKVYLPQ